MRLRDDGGHSLVEFALVAPIFLLLMFGVIDFAAMFFVNLTMLHAVRVGTRYAVTGQSSAGKDRMASLIQTVRDNSYGLYDQNIHTPKDPQVSVINPSQVSFTNYQGTAVTQPGNANDVIIVSLTYTWPLLTPVLSPFFPGGYTFTAKSTMKNESF